MVSGIQGDAASLVEIRRIQTLTVLWMSVEVAISAIAAMRAHSIAVLAFGGDSAIELLSGTGCSDAIFRNASH